MRTDKVIYSFGRFARKTFGLRWTYRVRERVSYKDVTHLKIKPEYLIIEKFKPNVDTCAGLCGRPKQGVDVGLVEVAE